MIDFDLGPTPASSAPVAIPAVQPVAVQPAAYQPAPVAPARPAPKSPVSLTTVLLVLIALAVGYDLYERHAASQPSQPPTALGLALATHYKTAPGEVVKIGDRVRTGELKTAADVVAAFAANAKPAAESLKSTVSPRCDKDGNVTDPAGLAEDLKRAGEFAGAK